MTPTNCGKIVKRRLRGWPPKARLLCDPYHINQWSCSQVEQQYRTSFPKKFMRCIGMTIHVLLFLCENMFCMRTPSCNVRNILRPVENCTVHLFIKSFVKLEHRIFSYICVFEKRAPKNVQACCQNKIEEWRIGMHPTVCRRVWCRWSVLHLVATIILATLFKIFAIPAIFSAA